LPGAGIRAKCKMDIPRGGEEKPVLYIGTSSEEVEDEEHATYVPIKSLY